MSEPFIGEIRIFAGNFAPRGWAFCSGQILPASQNNALFSLLGTSYGGDGRTNFALPDMRGRIPVHTGSGPGLTNRRLGNRFGQEGVRLTTEQLPAHQHTAYASNDSGNSPAPQDQLLAKQVSKFYADGQPSVEQFQSNMLSNAGGSKTHSNLMPTLSMNFIIALFGIYPSRN